MMHDGTRTRGGTMPVQLQEKVDRLLDELTSKVEAISQDRHLQKGIARSLLPCNMLAALDKHTLFIIGQFHPESRFSTYIFDPDASWTQQKVKNSAQWEFGFTDFFLIEIPAELLEMETEQRSKDLEKTASKHVDSEFMRFMDLLNLLRTRPIFGSLPAAGFDKSVYLLSPSDEPFNNNSKSIAEAIEKAGLPLIDGEDIRKGRSAVWAMWQSINQAQLIIADLTGPDPGVMYGLGIAHTIGKQTILILPKNSKYLADIPKTHKLEYEDGGEGIIKLKAELIASLRSLMDMMDI